LFTVVNVINWWQARELWWHHDIQNTDIMLSFHIVKLIVIILSVIMLSVIMLSVIMLSVGMLSVFMLNVVAPLW
jgi:hypothetical protein